MDKSHAGPPSTTGDAARTAALRQTAARARRAHLGDVRTTVRTQLVENQKRRERLSRALRELRQELIAFRQQVHSRLREIASEAASGRTDGET